MNGNSVISVIAPTDAELVARSLVGNSEAFGQIVARYQSLVCSLAYSATGSLGESEDLAQETFITAWKHLRHLREAARLRAWLCGIARNRIRNFLRREGREPVHKAQEIDAEHESVAQEPIPADYVISKEEAAILWRSLERLPEAYREPLILFYREGESVQRVATELELSEDAVKQRLSRGRKMLAEEVTAFVEGALRQSAPGKAFTLGVLAALPLMTTSAKAAAIAATAAKGSAAAKTAGFAGLFSGIAAPVMILLGAYFGYRLEMDTAKSPQVRDFVKKFYAILGVFTVLLTVLVLLAIHFAKPLLRSDPRSFINLLLSLGTAYVIVVISLAIWAAAKQKQIRGSMSSAKGGATQGATSYWEPAFEYRSKRTLWGLPLVHIRLRAGIHRGPVKAWIAMGDSAIGGLFALGGLAVAPISFGGLAAGMLCFGGLGMGLVSLGGLSLGVLASGGLAIGVQAFGGLAVGWKAAQGGLAVAHELAQGGLALAQHGNDQIARSFFESSAFFRVMPGVMCYGPLLTLLNLFPLFLWRHAVKKRMENAAHQNS